MDIDVFPNSLEYWGPTGMVFFRNVQVRYMPIKGDTRLTLALERPGASGDGGVYADRVELQNIRPRFPLPDFSAEYRRAATWGYVEAAGILRLIKWDDVLDDQFDLSGDGTGWGINLSSNVKASANDTLRLQFVIGEGIQNYMNDSPVDVGIVNNPGNPVQPILGKTVPIIGIVAFLDHNWNKEFSSAIGYSMQDNDNREAQAPDAFRRGHYALGNLLYYAGAERDGGRRVAVGTARELLRRLPERRLQGAVLVQVQLFLQARRLVMRRTTYAAALVLAVAAGTFTLAQSGADAQKAVDAAHAKFQTLKEGKNADYIPALAKVDPNLFGIALVTADGKVYTAGDVKTEVSIQSISKVFTMAQVIEEQGLDSIAKRIGVDATGARFNSIIAIEGVRTVIGTGAPEMNPLVNPGAISATSMVRGGSSDEVWKKIIGFHNDSAGRQLSVLQEVYKSESDTNQRNQAIGALMLAYGYIKDNWQQAVDLYTRQCSIGVNARDLGVMAGDAGVWRQESGHRQAGHGRDQGAGSTCGHGDGGTLRRLRQVAVCHRPSGEERRRRRHHRRVAGQVRHRRRLAAARRRGEQRAGAAGDHRDLERPRRQPLRESQGRQLNHVTPEGQWAVRPALRKISQVRSTLSAAGGLVWSRV